MMDEKPTTQVDPHAGFEAFYRATHGGLVTSMLLVSGDAELAREATDEAFARAVGAWNRVSAMDSPAGWTYRVALNAMRRRARRAGLERRLLARQRPAPAVPAPAGEAWAIVADLPPRQRTAVVLRHVADLTEPQIAAAMGVSRSTVSSTLADAAAALRRALADPAGPADPLDDPTEATPGVVHPAGGSHG
jgi:DNA-directed RNA polymerase specialized sigma24 family protein